MFTRRFAALVFVLLSIGLLGADKAAKPPKKDEIVKKFMESLAAQAKEAESAAAVGKKANAAEIAKAEKGEIDRSSTKKMRVGKNGKYYFRSPKDRSEYVATLRDNDAELQRKADDAKNSPISTLAPRIHPPFRVGQIGVMATSARIIQIIGDDQALVDVIHTSPKEFYGERTETVMLKGQSMKEHTDDARISLVGLYVVSETYRYNTAGGATRTVFLLESVVSVDEEK